MSSTRDLAIARSSVITLAPVRASHGAPASASEATSLAAEVGRQTADIAAVMFRFPVRQNVRAMFEAEIQDEVADLFSDDAELDPAECEQCRLVAWLAFDRRLALHARNQDRGGRA